MKSVCLIFALVIVSTARPLESVREYRAGRQADLKILIAQIKLCLDIIQDATISKVPRQCCVRILPALGRAFMLSDVYRHACKRYGR